MAWTLVLVAVATSLVNLAPSLPDGDRDEIPKVTMPDPDKVQVWRSTGVSASTTIYTPAITMIAFPTAAGCEAAAGRLLAAKRASFSDAVCVEIR